MRLWPRPPNITTFLPTRFALWPARGHGAVPLMLGVPQVTVPSPSVSLILVKPQAPSARAVITTPKWEGQGRVHEREMVRACEGGGTRAQQAVVLFVLVPVNARTRRLRLCSPSRTQNAGCLPVWPSGAALYCSKLDFTPNRNPGNAT